VASPLDPFIPTYDARERFQLRVRAPARLVYETAAHFDLQSVALVRAIFWLRGRLLGAGPTPSRPFATGFLAGARQLGWGVLREEPGHLFVAGAYCQPWQADVVFTPLAPTTFAPYAAPGRVKIAWTLEVEAVDAGHSLLASETRAVGTSPDAQRHFRSYWRWARFGIHTIRWLLLPAIRRRAEARYTKRAGTAV
jgi:hypothetical protein